MMVRQNCSPVLVSDKGTSILQPVSIKPIGGASEYDEAWVQNLIFAHPAALPLAEIAPAFGPLIPICTELDTRSAGYADALFMNTLGMPTLVECKLWRNPQARREVVGQIIDYARVLRGWTYVDLQRQVAQARRERGFDLSRYVGMRSNDPDFSEAAFCDAVGRNLRRGHILLLIVGDGIREGVEAIAEYIQDTAALHFVLGLVEVAVFRLPEGGMIVQPRILAKTIALERTVFGMPSNETQSIEPPSSLPVPARPQAELAAVQRAPNEREEWMRGFWTELMSTLSLDDADQPLARVIADSAVEFPMPARGEMWLTCYFRTDKRETGVFLGMLRTSARALAIADRLEMSAIELGVDFDSAGVSVRIYRRADEKLMIAATKRYSVLREDAVRAEQLEWFRRTINAFVNVLKPRICELMNDLM